MAFNVSWILEQDARALLTRLARVKPFALLEPMVPAAAISLAAQVAIERYLDRGRRELRQMVHDYLDWLQSVEGRSATPAEAYRKFTILRLRFNAVLSQFDIFSDVITQRSEHDNGVWLAGLDVVAADALNLPGGYYDAPPVMCYLDRGAGAAIRRARTRLPGGGENPAAIIRVPRERMVGSGIASSLVHEVGHQAAALLGLLSSLRPKLNALQERSNGDCVVWRLFERWLSEIVADFWSVARVGIASTRGLMGVVSLPRAFVFRLNLDDPHPPPWIRVKLSCAMGNALYPDPQWEELGELWESFYPLEGIDDERMRVFTRLKAGMEAFVSLLLSHRPKALGGLTLHEVMDTEDRQPARLAVYYNAWRKAPGEMRAAPPSLVFAVLGQAGSDGRLPPEEDSRILGKLLTHWALESTLNTSALCTVRRMAPVSLTGT